MSLALNKFVWSSALGSMKSFLCVSENNFIFDYFLFIYFIIRYPRGEAHSHVESSLRFRRLSDNIFFSNLLPRVYYVILELFLMCKLVN